MAALNRDPGDRLLRRCSLGSPLTTRSGARSLAAFFPLPFPSVLDALRVLFNHRIAELPNVFRSLSTQVGPYFGVINDADIVLSSASGDTLAYSRYAALLR